jgi:hypothetical protein
MNEDKLASPPARAPTRAWTGIEAYFASLARRRTERHRRERPHFHPEAPRLWLSILPFVVLLAALAIFAVAIAIDAWPGRERPQAQPKPQPREIGTAPPGWLEPEKRELRQRN